MLSARLGLDTERAKAAHLLGVVREQLDALDVEVFEHERRESVGARVVRKTEESIGIDGVVPARLQIIRADLVRLRS